MCEAVGQYVISPTVMSVKIKRDQTILNEITRLNGIERD